MQDPDIDSGVWAVIYLSGGKRLIGRFETTSVSNEETKPTVEQLERELANNIAKGEVFPIFDAFEFISSLIPVQGPGGSPAMTRVTQCAPADAGMHPAKICTKIEGFRLFDSMEESDRQDHKGLLVQILDHLREARMRRLGIATAGPVDLDKLMRENLPHIGGRKRND